MRDDDAPTVPMLRWENAGGRAPGGAPPTWPGVDAPRPPTSPAVPTRDRHPIVLGISLVANGVLLASLVGLLLLAHAGVFSPPSSSGQSVSPGSALSSSSATPSLTPVSGWLQVAPTSVQLGCNADQQTQVVVLRNTGPEEVHWQVEFAVPADQAGVAIDGREGDLKAGTSVALQIQYRSHAADQQGVLRFDPGTPAAGSPPSLSYTIVGCQ